MAIHVDTDYTEPEDPCDACRRVLSAMSTEPGPDAFGMAFRDCRMAACWMEMNQRVTVDMEGVPF